MCGNMIDNNDLLNADMIGELKEILADDFAMLVNSYLDDAVRRMALLKNAIQDSDAEIIRNEAHSLKGSSLNLGALTLPEMFSKMEASGKDNQLESVAELFSDIELEFSRVEAALKATL